MLCLCTTLGQDGLTARLLLGHSGHVLGGQVGSRSLRGRRASPPCHWRQARQAAQDLRLLPHGRSEFGEAPLDEAAFGAVGGERQCPKVGVAGFFGSTQAAQQVCPG
jgi:hypothetical protein